jgi:hypothetical protein
MPESFRPRFLEESCFNESQTAYEKELQRVEGESRAALGKALGPDNSEGIAGEQVAKALTKKVMNPVSYSLRGRNPNPPGRIGGFGAGTITTDRDQKYCWCGFLISEHPLPASAGSPCKGGKGK